jgi:hypothetical protein
MAASELGGASLNVRSTKKRLGRRWCGGASSDCRGTRMGTPDSTNAVWKLNVKMGVAAFTWDGPSTACRRRRRRPRPSRRGVAAGGSVGVYGEDPWLRTICGIEGRGYMGADSPRSKSGEGLARTAQW